MIKPTVGRVVWYHREETDPGVSTDDQPNAAIIAHVHPDACVDLLNLLVIDSSGSSFSQSDVPLVQEGAPIPSGRYCQWMPYQIGQAAKTEALQAEKTAKHEDAEHEPHHKKKHGHK